MRICYECLPRPKCANSTEGNKNLHLMESRGEGGGGPWQRTEDLIIGGRGGREITEEEGGASPAAPHEGGKARRILERETTYSV